MNTRPSNRSRWHTDGLCQHFLGTLLLVALLVSHGNTAYADPVTVNALSTTLISDAERMIALRHTERMWQTGDGALHVLINQGGLAEDGASLQLYTSLDAGQSWQAMNRLTDTDKFSTADGLLIGDNLGIAYAANNGKILYSILRYNRVTKVWTLLKTETVVDAADSVAINPAIAVDDIGRLWCAFVNKIRGTLETNIKLFQRTADGSLWQDTGLTFGPTDVDATVGERSARPVITANGVGMIYTVRENIFWAYRLNTWPATTPWVEQVIFTGTPPYDRDPYNSHFSVVVDGNRNVHMATVDHGKLLYLRFVNRTQSWNPVRTLTSDIYANYPQISIAQNVLAIVVNAGQSAIALQSTNVGNTFSYTTFLTHDAPPPDGSVSYANPRIETPGKSFGPIPVFQQYVEGSTQRLMYFQVPLITGP